MRQHLSPLLYNTPSNPALLNPYTTPRHSPGYQHCAPASRCLPAAGLSLTSRDLEVAAEVHALPSPDHRRRRQRREVAAASATASDDVATICADVVSSDRRLYHRRWMTMTSTMTSSSQHCLVIVAVTATPWIDAAKHVTTTTLLTQHSSDRFSRCHRRYRAVSTPLRRH